jgi:hypothetical protein
MLNVGNYLADVIPQLVRVLAAAYDHAAKYSYEHMIIIQYGGL